MKKPTDIGTNRTGIATSPIDSRRTMKEAEAATSAPPVVGNPLEAERVSWAREAEPLGTVPPPGTVKGVAKSVLEALQGHKPTVFIDKLGERLAFERTGVRLYDALLVKYEAASVHEGGPTRQDLERQREDERNHYALVRNAIQYLGADPTAMTPSADLVAVAGLGWVEALSDPRTTLSQCLDIMLMAELSDTASWSLLVELADGLGFDDLAQQFRSALVTEERHASNVRMWISNSLLGQSGVSPTPPQPHGTAA